MCLRCLYCTRSLCPSRQQMLPKRPNHNGAHRKCVDPNGLLQGSQTIGNERTHHQAGQDVNGEIHSGLARAWIETFIFRTCQLHSLSVLTGPSSANQRPSYPLLVHKQSPKVDSQRVVLFTHSKLLDSVIITENNIENNIQLIELRGSHQRAC